MATTENQVILDINVDYGAALQSIEKMRQELDKLAVEQMKLQAIQKDGKTANEESAKALELVNARIKDYQSEIRSVQKEVQNNAKIERQRNEERKGSMSSLRAQLSILTKQYDELSRAERDSAKGDELRKKINITTNELKKAEEATQRYYRNVGNYENAIKGALGANSKWFQGLQALSDAFKSGVTPALKQAATAVASFGKQLLSLLLNPVVATIAGIAAVITLVTKAIKSNEE